MNPSSHPAKFSLSFVSSQPLYSHHPHLTNTLTDYRGHWCPFCNAYLKSLQSLTPSITSSSGTIVAITSQPAEFTALTRKQSGYTGRIIVDVNNEIASALRERKVVDVAVTPTKGYEHGMAQPAVVVFAKGGKVVLERWAIVPGVVSHII